MELQLTKGFVAIIDDEDADLAEFKWTTYIDLKRSSGPYAYRTLRINGKQKSLRLHKVILERMLQRQLSLGEVADHKDGNPLNNRRENLRVASYSENKSNSKLSKRNSSGYRGVSQIKGRSKWRAIIGFQGKQIFIGFFNSKQEASEAYERKASELFGEFKRSN